MCVECYAGTRNMTKFSPLELYMIRTSCGILLCLILCVVFHVCSIFLCAFESVHKKRNWFAQVLGVKVYICVHWGGAQAMADNNAKDKMWQQKASYALNFFFYTFSFSLFLSAHRRSAFHLFRLAILRVQKCDPILAIMFSLFKKRASHPWNHAIVSNNNNSQQFIHFAPSPYTTQTIFHSFFGSG